MSDDQREWCAPEALARIDALFGHRDEARRHGLSPVFLDKYAHWFGPSAVAVSRRLDRRWRRLSRRLGPGAVRGRRALDAGAGFGINALLLALAGAREVVAVDLRPDRIDDLARLASVVGLDAVRPLCAPYATPMAGDPFDLVYCSYFLSHLDEDDTFFDLCRDALTPGGQLYVADDNNALSPVRQVAVRREWWSAELLGNRDNRQGFLAMRRAAIDDEMGAISGPAGRIRRELGAWATRGMTLDDTRAYARALADPGLPRPGKPPFAYCDPVNGIAEERLLNPLRMARQLRARGFDVTLFPGETAPLARLRAALSPEFDLVATRRPTG